MYPSSWILLAPRSVTRVAQTSRQKSLVVSKCVCWLWTWIGSYTYLFHCLWSTLKEYDHRKEVPNLSQLSRFGLGIAQNMATNMNSSQNKKHPQVFQYNQLREQLDLCVDFCHQPLFSRSALVLSSPRWFSGVPLSQKEQWKYLTRWSL